MPATPHCAMNMLWNTQVVDTCIIFSSWHVHNTAQFVMSFFAIALLGVAYEGIRYIQHKYDAYLMGTSVVVNGGQSQESLLEGLRASPGLCVTPFQRAIRAVLYGGGVLLSFFLMLMFMTYNAYIILAVVVGAITGHFIFNPQLTILAAKGAGCH
ncbi:Ctr copper transporter [Cylindrobasidium torrendii FP15055 ss-10]|uniref:Copper transport protein n=1 Tax=Cylindrobasidium torrendii FP15055 ss-10 TaxID=1314674 RepID=A0A0D7BPJ8_9AGAR|nr:Ctr copper transporter [Cylindrobasidium torrendii FP15055 ss-10]